MPVDSGEADRNLADGGGSPATVLARLCWGVGDSADTRLEGVVCKLC